MTISNHVDSGWTLIDDGPAPLRCWRAEPIAVEHDKGDKSPPNRVVLVLPEVFGVNAWVRSVADRLAEQGWPALAMPLFARTAPRLDLGYGDADLAEGRRHKEATSTEQILSDVGAAIAWMQKQRPRAQVSVIGFCFGGHAALIAATHPAVVSSFDFYGADVSRTRPGGGPPALELLPEVRGRLTCLCGTADPLIPAEDRVAIASALAGVDSSGQRLRYVALEGADHGFMCEARDAFQPAAAARGWDLLLEDLNGNETVGWA